MPTTKKTTTTAAPAKKAVSKPVKAAAPAKKAKAATPPVKKHRDDYKPGTRVKVIRRNGVEQKGFVVDVKRKKTGAFIVVNVGTKQVEIITEARPAMVRGF